MPRRTSVEFSELTNIQKFYAYRLGKSFSKNPTAYYCAGRLVDFFHELKKSGKSLKIFRKVKGNSLEKEGQEIANEMVVIVRDCIEKHDGKALRDLGDAIELWSAPYCWHPPRDFEGAFIHWLFFMEIMKSVRPIYSPMTFPKVWALYEQKHKLVAKNYSAMPDLVDLRTLRNRIDEIGIILTDAKRGRPTNRKMV
jgi:hypothetical protein